MSEDPPIRNTQMSIVRNTGKPGSPAGAALATRTDDIYNRRVPSGPNIWKITHGALRGRYLAVIALGVASAVGLGALAYHWTAKPTFSSEGLLRIAYIVPTMQGEAEQSAMPNFEAFMQQQKTLIATRGLAEAAARDLVWQQAGIKPPADAEAYYSKHLMVDQKPKSELIKVTVNDTDAEVAATAVTALVNAYIDFYNSQDKQTDRNLMARLEELQRSLTTQVEKIDEQIRAKAQPFGTTDLDEAFLTLQKRRTSIESSINDLQIMIAELPVARPPAVPAVSRGQQDSIDEMSLDQMVAADATVRMYWEKQAELQGEVDRLTRYGYGPSHRLMVAATRGLQEAQAKTQKAVDEFRRTHVGGGNSGEPLASATAGQAMENLKIREDRLKAALAPVKAEMVAVGNARMELNQLKETRAAKQAELVAVNRRLENKQTEGAIGGRLSVISKGDAALVPSRDLRPQVATAAGFMGFFIPAIAVVGISLLRRRHRYSDEPGADLMVTKVPLMGMLPYVPARSSPQMRLSAAYAAHHLRVLLSSRATSVVKRTFLVTSAGEGEGKTTVTMALAISFAAAKHRTLVIDGDFVGRRLTRGFNAEQQEGFFESLGHGDLDGQWLNASTNLCVLPTGKADAADACGITAENVRQLLEQAIQHFDVVLIDTGSILGSPESAVLAREVDGVIVTIARGQSQGQVKKALLRLEALGATVVGRIFNRADMTDFQTSYVTPMPIDEPHAPSQEKSELQQRVANFGPLVRAVAEAVPSEGPSESPRIGSSEHVTRT